MYITIYRIKPSWQAQEDNFRTVADVITDNIHYNVQMATMDTDMNLTISVNARTISTTRDKEGNEHLIVVVNDRDGLPHFINLKSSDYEYMTSFME